MATREAIISKLKEYFLKKGFELLLPEEVKLEKLTGLFDLFFRDGNNIIVIKVYTPRNLLVTQIRKKLELIVVDILKYREYFDKAYVAIPENIGLLKIPREIFENSGIGILQVGITFVEEKLPAKVLGTRKFLVQDQLVKEIVYREISSLNEKLEGEIYEIRSEIKTLRKELNSIYESLKIIEKEINILKKTKSVSVKEPIKAVKEIEKISFKSSEEFPDFIADNPWVSLLARRGRENEQ